MKNSVMRSSWFVGSLSFLLVMVLVLLGLMTHPVFADSAAGSGSAAVVPPTTALEDLHTQLMAVLVPAFVLVVTALATWIGLKIKAKLHLDVSEKTMEQWNNLARAAALRGAEWARTKTKAIVDGKKLPGGEVMDVAAKWAIQMAEHQGLPALASEKLQGLIESQLFQLRREEAVTPTDPTKPAPAV